MSIHALLSANVSFSFIDNNKLFKMLHSLYDLLLRKWISIELIEVLDKVYKEVNHKIEKFTTKAKFLTLYKKQMDKCI